MTGNRRWDRTGNSLIPACSCPEFFRAFCRKCLSDRLVVHASDRDDLGGRPVAAHHSDARGVDAESVGEQGDDRLVGPTLLGWHLHLQRKEITPNDRFGVIWACQGTCVSLSAAKGIAACGFQPEQNGIAVVWHCRRYTVSNAVYHRHHHDVRHGVPPHRRLLSTRNALRWIRELLSRMPRGLRC